MKLSKKILIPLAAVAASVGAVAPIVVSTSCSCRPGLMGTHDMLNSNYTHHVVPEGERSIIGKQTLLNEYHKVIFNNTDVLKDDILYTYSKVLTNDESKARLDFEFSRYFLYVDDIKVDETNKQVSMNLWTELTGTVKAGKTYLVGGEYLREFTFILGGSISTSFTLDTLGESTFDQFKDTKKIFKFTVPDLATNKPTYRTYVSGAIGTSTTASGEIKTKAISVDETKIISQETDKTEYIKLFDKMVLNITKDGLAQTTDDIYVASYYFKNIKYTE